MSKYKLIDLNNIMDNDSDDVKTFLKYNGINKFDDFDIEAMKKIAHYITNENRIGFNVSYNIIRLDKEFDLVKISNEYLINIELKLTKKDIEQCKKNYKIFKIHYPDNDINIFCYESKQNILYRYNDEKKKLELSDFDELDMILSKVNNSKILDINININSIYMEPSFFLEKKYDLSYSQSITKGKVLNAINNCEKKIILISGRAGTGKTLLALDLMDNMVQENKEVIYLTPFKMNKIVDNQLIKKYKMETVKLFINSLNRVDYIIIDEAQRLKESDIEVLKELVNKKIILLGDINQNIDNESCFEKLYEDKKENEVYSMNQIIRTDDTFDLYARKILGLPTIHLKNKRFDTSKIEIEILNSTNKALLDKYVFLEPGKSFFNAGCRKNCKLKICDNISSRCMRRSVPYDVISREYSKVVIFLCKNYIVVNDKISVKDSVCYGNLTKQLYSIITRCIDSLKIITDDIVMYNFLNKKLDELSIQKNTMV